MTRLVPVLSEIIPTSRKDEWSELRSLIFETPFYKCVSVKISNGEREDWDMKAYDEKQYVVEHEPLWDGLAQSVPPHWCQNPTDFQLVNSLMHVSPPWLREILGPLSKLYRPLRFNLPNPQFRNYEELANGGASLACLTNLSDTAYEVFAVKIPPHMLERDMAGSVRVSGDHELFLDGGEIKSSERCKNTFNAYPLVKLSDKFSVR